MNTQTSANPGPTADSPTPQTIHTAVLRTADTDPSGEPVVLLQQGAARVVGPGRRERAYQDRIAGLETEREADDQARAALGAEVEMARLVERGTGRLVDRLERSLEQGQAELGEVRSQGHRLMVALGALQRENRALRAELERGDLERGELERASLDGGRPERVRARLLETPRHASRGGLLRRLWGGRRRVAP